MLANVSLHDNRDRIQTIECSDVSFSVDEVGSFIHVLEFIWFSLSADSFFFFFSPANQIMISNNRPHPPCVSVLVSDLLLHLCVCQRLQQGAPLVSITCVSDCYLHCGQRVFTAKEKPTETLIQFPLLQRPLPAAAHTVMSLSLNVFQSWGSKTSSKTVSVTPTKYSFLQLRCLSCFWSWNK